MLAIGSTKDRWCLRILKIPARVVYEKKVFIFFINKLGYINGVFKGIRDHFYVGQIYVLRSAI